MSPSLHPALLPPEPGSGTDTETSALVGEVLGQGAPEELSLTTEFMATALWKRLSGPRTSRMERGA